MIHATARTMVRALFLVLPFLPCAAAGEYGPEEPPQEKTLAVADIPVRIETTQVGDWASYTTDEGHTLKLTVIERHAMGKDDIVVVQSSLKKGKKKRPVVSEEVIDVRERAADMRDLGPDDTLGESVVLAGGRKLSCIVVTYHDDDRRPTRQSYLSDEVPVYGLVRGVSIEGNKRTTALRLDDFGFGDGD